MSLYVIILFSVFFLLTAFKDSLAAPVYEGKVIKIIVGHGAGGGYDRMARLFARHLPKYISGKPAVIVENMPGASSMICANFLYNIAKPDGLTIGTFDRSLPFAQLLKAEGVKFDLIKFSWIGSTASESAILTLRTDLPYKNLDEVRRSKQPLHLATVGTAATDYQFPILLKEFLDLQLKMVMYPSSAEGILAVERKEADGRAGSYSALKPFIERGLVHPLIRGRVSEPGIEHLPVDENFTTDPKGKTIMAMRSSGDRVGRPFVAPPNTPSDIMNMLRDAFAHAAKDSELKEESKKMMMAVEYVPADECIKVLHYILNQPEDMVREFNKYIKF